MRRREFVAGVGVLLIPSAGCTVSNSDESDPTRPTEIIDWSSKLDIRTDANGFDPPRISADRDEAVVVVRGMSPAGNNCSTITPTEPEYDPDSSVLMIKVRRVSERDGCGDVFTAESYEISVQFDTGIPRKVIAEEPVESAETTY